MGPKIATCTYCGTRAALVLGGADRHELACSACGAPLHDLKAIPAARTGKPAPFRPKPPPHRLDVFDLPKPKRKNRKKKKSFRQKLLSKAFDALDDLFD